MDIDLVTNGSKIRDCVHSLNSGIISWIVLGYTNNKTINVIETGGDSFEDMFEEFDSNKIMYGFASVTDPNSKLKKNVFIHWQGEAASQSMKTMSVQHANIVRDLCKPVHVTHHARDEQDLDLKEIMIKVASASGSNYSCHNETKQVYQNVSSVKSEENTANSVRQNRLRELSTLSSLPKETVTEQHIGSTYEKVNAVKEIQNSRNKAPENNSPKPLASNYKKIDAAKEIKASSQVPDRQPVSYQKVGTNYVKVDASKEIKSTTSTAPMSLNLAPAYRKINPEQELKSLNLNQKTMFENKAKVQSENNTAQRAKEERQKEMTNLFSKRINYDDDADRKVGTNYTRVNPVAEIKKLRSASITHDDDVPLSPGTNYKKIDPAAEFQNIRRCSTSDQNEPVSPGTNYKKINPAEEIRKLKSQSTFEDVRPTSQGYKKINPIEEINSVRRLSSALNKTETEQKTGSTTNTGLSNVVKPATVFSARQTFEHAHKTNDGHQAHKTHSIKHDIIPEVKQSFNNTRFAEPAKTEMLQEAPFDADEVKVELNTNIMHNNYVNTTTSAQVDVPRVSNDNKSYTTPDSMNNNCMNNTAEAQFSYQAADNDEISFEEGEIIREIEVIDDDWWQGVNAAGQRGMFPSNYVMSHDVQQPKKEDQRVTKTETPMDLNNYNGSINTSPMAAATAITIPSPPVSEPQSTEEPANLLTATAIFDYQANDNDEISFDVGEILREIEQIDEGWWIGVNKAGVKGMFPSNFVELNSTQQAANVESKEIGGNDSGSQQQVSHDSFTVRAIYDYSAQGNDEVSFVCGDLIYDIVQVDEGWWEGTVTSGQRGLFPSNYVETA